MSSQKTGKRRRPPLSLPPGPRGRRAGMPPPPLKAPRTHDGARDQEGTGPAGTRIGDDSASPESAPGNTEDDDYIYPDADGGSDDDDDDDDDDMHVAVGQAACPIRGRAAEEDARQQELARVMAESRRDAWSNENASSGGAAETSHNQGSSSSRGASGEDTPDSDSHVQLSDGDEDFESDSRSAGRTPVFKRRKREPEVAPSVWTVPGANTRGFVGRYNPAGGDCGPYSIGQVASSETPSPDELRGYRQAGVKYVIDHRDQFSTNFWLGHTPEERASKRDDWAERMRQPGEWADFALMLGMRAVYCSNAIIVEPAFPDNPENRKLSAYGQDVLDASKPMIMIQGGVHFLVLEEVGRGGDGGNGDGDALEPSSSSGDTDGDGSSSGSGSGKSRSRSSSSGSRSRSRSSSGGSSSGGSGSTRRRDRSSSSSDGGGGGGALSPAQADAMKSLERNAAWFLRIEDREVTLAEKQEARRLLENPRELHGLRNEALKNPQVYRGTRSAEDLDRHQLRNLAGAAILPKNGLHAVYDNFEGDLGRMREEFDNAADGGLALFMDFLQSKGGEGRVHEDHPAFADPASWNKPVLCMQGMCRQGLKLPFFHRAQTTVTGKVAKACDAVSPFVGGPVAKMNRTLASCVKIVTDSDGSSVPHCSAVGLLRRELVGTAMVVEVAWMRALLHNFPNSRGVGLLRGGDITTAGRGRNQVQELAAVGGRTAFVYHGNHQCRALGAEDALDGSVRGPLELYRACTGGPPVTEKDVAYGTVDLVGAVLDLQVEAQGGATDNDERRYAELIEATVQGHAQARAKALEVAREIRGKATRSRDDCASGGRKGGKGTQGHKISSSGGSRGARTGREPINDSSVMVSIGFFRRAHKITVGEKIVDVKISKRKSEFFRFRDVRGTDSNKWIIGLRRFDSNGSDKNLSYPADDEGNMVTGEEWDADPEKGLYHDHLVTYAWKYLQKRERATAPAQS